MKVNRPVDPDKLLERITYNPDILGGKPTIRGRRLAVEHVLAQLAVGDSPDAVQVRERPDDLLGMGQVRVTARSVLLKGLRQTRLGP